jgi:hypothetical protein
MELNKQLIDKEKKIISIELKNFLTYKNRKKHFDKKKTLFEKGRKSWEICVSGSYCV